MAPRRRGRCIVRSIRIVTGRKPSRRAGISAISAHTARTGNRSSTGCCASRRGAGREAVSRSPVRSILLISAGRRMSSARACRPGRPRGVLRQATLHAQRDAGRHVRCGWSPSVRLFEAAACGAPIISDWWPGLDDFFLPGEDILVVQTTEAMLEYLHDVPDSERLRLAGNARKRIVAAHTADHRAAELESYVAEVRERGGGTGRRGAASRSAENLPEAAE